MTQVTTGDSALATHGQHISYDNDALHDAAEDAGTNRSDNTPFAEVLRSAENGQPSRRGVIVGSLAAAASTGFLAPEAVGQSVTPGGADELRGWRRPRRR